MNPSAAITQRKKLVGAAWRPSGQLMTEKTKKRGQNINNSLPPLERIQTTDRVSKFGISS